MAAPANIVYFTGYELLRDASPLKDHGWLNPLLCGSIARTFAGTTIAPIELLKTRLQSIPNSKKKVLGPLMNDLRQDLAQRGPQVLFRGLALTLWRDVPFSGIYWASYEYLKSALASNPQWHFTGKKDSDLFLHSFISGSISGSIAACVTNPFDVGKTRLQISNESGMVKEKNMVKFMVDIVRFDGVRALYVGLIPRLFKVAPSCAIMISSYELGKRFFASSA
jgi:solute carrier family 25 protein 39/40